jgi:hypothetical protein
MSKIFIATPMYGGNCTIQYMNSILRLQIELATNKYVMSFSATQNESLITRARNILSDAFLKSDSDYLLFIDADHGFNPKDVIKMIDSNKDIICAIPPKKEINWKTVGEALDNNLKNPELYTGSFVIGMKEKTRVSSQEPFEILHGGTGMMLIKRSVLEKMKDDLPTYSSDNFINIEARMVTEFFKTEIEDGILLSEDYSFCKKWREMGGKVYAAPWVYITHVGPYEFSGSFLHTASLQNMPKS